MTLTRKPLVTEAKAFVDDRPVSGPQPMTIWRSLQMKRNKKRILVAILAICALAAGGAAFTASNTLPGTDVAGYGSVSVSGATVDSIHNNLDTTGANITSVDLVFHSAVTTTVQAMFDDETALDSCADTNSGTDTHY